MSNANNRIKVLESYYREIDALIAAQAEVIDTYNGMLSYCNDGEGADHLLTYLDTAEAELEALKADRRELDATWNEDIEGAPRH